MLYNKIFNYYYDDNKVILESVCEDNQGNELEVKLYLWRSEELGMVTGLVCLTEKDTKANEYSRNKYENN